MSDIWKTTAIAQTAIVAGTAAATAVEHRSDIIQMTQTAENAVLRPKEPGAWPHALRAAFACRIARLNGSTELANRYLSMMDSSEFAAISDPNSVNEIEDLMPALVFIDRVATEPKDIAADDILVLQDADVADADIVRLTELVAFLAYQIRLVAGLALLAGDAS